MDLSETDREIEITVKESDIQRNVGRMFWRSAVKRRASAKRPRRTIILSNAAMLHSPEPYNRRKAGHRRHQGGDVQRCIEGDGAEAGARSNQEDRDQGGGLSAKTALLQ